VHKKQHFPTLFFSVKKHQNCILEKLENRFLLKGFLILFLLYRQKPYFLK